MIGCVKERQKGDKMYFRVFTRLVLGSDRARNHLGSDRVSDKSVLPRLTRLVLGSVREC